MSFVSFNTCSNPIPIHVLEEASSVKWTKIIGIVVGLMSAIAALYAVYDYYLRDRLGIQWNNDEKLLEKIIDQGASVIDEKNSFDLIGASAEISQKIGSIEIRELVQPTLSLQRTHSSPDALEEGIKLLDAGKITEAKELLKEIYETVPTDLKTREVYKRALVLLGSAHFQKGLFDKAQVTFNEMLSIDPNDHVTKDYLSRIEIKRFEDHRNQGNHYLEAEQWDKAEMEFIAALKIVPEDPLTCARYGFVLCQSAKQKKGKKQREVLNTALELFDKAYTKVPKDRFTLENYGRLLINLENWKGAVDKFQKAIEAIRPMIDEDLKALFVFSLGCYGKQLLEQARIDKAIQIFEKALKVNPDHVFSLGHYAEAKHLKGDWEQARKVFEQALQLKSTDLFSLAHYGEMLRQQGELEQAEDIFKQALEIDPKNVFILGRYGQLFFQKQSFEMAEKKFQKALKYDPKDCYVLMHYAELLRQQGKWDEAVEKFELSLSQKPNDPFILGHYGEVLRQLGKLDEAAKKLKAAFEIDPKNEFILTRYGELFRQQFRLAEAAQKLKTALEIDSKNVFALGRYGEVLRQQGKKPEAKEQFETALVLDAHDVFVLARYGELLREEGKLAESAEKFEAAYKINNIDIFTLVQYGELFKQMGQPEEGIKKLEAAYALSPSDPKIKERYSIFIFNQGVALHKKNSKIEAINKFAFACQLNPENTHMLGVYGDALREEKKYKEAETPLKIAYEKDKTDLFNLTAYAKTLFALKRNQESQQIIEEALKIEPKEKEGKKFLDDLKKLMKKIKK